MQCGKIKLGGVIKGQGCWGWGWGGSAFSRAEAGEGASQPCVLENNKEGGRAWGEEWVIEFCENMRSDPRGSFDHFKVFGFPRPEP